jgi:Ser/Thr protein kinase RdoA (MazF antagonist)
VTADQDSTEEPLVHAGVTPGIVRIGGTVRRPVRPFSATVHAYLAHLQASGFTGAPVPLGFDDRGREVLSYVPGEVPVEPLPDWATGEDVLRRLGGLIRSLHDAAMTFTAPPDAVWSSPPGGPVPGPPPDGPPELVSHRDYCPGNVVFRDGMPVALIDFDLARPTTRLYDIANAMYWWLPLLDPADRAPALAGADIPGRAAMFADAYGLDNDLRSRLVPFATDMVRRFHRSARLAAQHDPAFRRMWEDGVKDRMPRAEAWIEAAGPDIAAALAAPAR